VKEAQHIHESLKSAKADTFATLVSRSMPHGRRAPLHDGTRVRERTSEERIFGDESPGYDGTIDDATNYFTKTFGPRTCGNAKLLEELSSFVPSAEPDTSLFDAPSPDELATKLRSMCNSAPGQDRLEYRHLRLLDPKCEILAKMFRHCFVAKDVPASWKSATTILIHKKEDTSDASNFRPIALMSCLYKLLMAVLAKCMTSFAIHNDILSNEQKSAALVKDAMNMPFS
jgi:hypothetical protein